eukprot:8331205-Pyramimonas_sp.AAC.1
MSAGPSGRRGSTCAAARASREALSSSGISESAGAQSASLFGSLTSIISLDELMYPPAGA